jgi:hypothetical protein
VSPRALGEWLGADPSWLLVTDRGFVLVTSNDASQDELPTVYHFCQHAGPFIEPSWDMVELEAVEPVLQLADLLAICGHLGTVTAGFFHDLIDDQLQDTLDLKPSDAQLDGDTQVVDDHFILSHVIRGGKMNTDHIPPTELTRQMKISPAPSPFLLSNPSKYTVHHSSSTAASGIWISVHFAMKSASVFGFGGLSSGV